MEFHRHWRQPAEAWVAAVDVIVAEYHNARRVLGSAMPETMKAGYRAKLRAMDVPEFEASRWLDARARPAAPVLVP